MHILPALVVVALAAHAPAPPDSAHPIAIRLGVVTSSDSTGYLTILNSDLQPGALVTVLAPDSLTRDATVRVRSRVPRANWPRQPQVTFAEGLEASVYVVEPLRPRAELPVFGFGVLGRVGVYRRSARGIAVDLDGDGRAERLYTCASEEGVHLIARSGVGGAVVWSAYDYVGYDLDVTCGESDAR